ncbi:MAG TPA: Gfo/Idh/MocA family oxidoreductase [Clostridia bacterium]
MKFVVVGLGSMGKRRIRNLLANGEADITGVDIREDRRVEASSKYGISICSSIHEKNILNDADAVIISVPPDKHMEYAHMAADAGKHCFIEASVTDAGMSELISKNKSGRVKICPSCTLRFHPSIIKIKSLIESGSIGKLSNFSYHSGQYLPDWHPWEDIRDYYVSNSITGGCREIVPFELTWLNWVFGEVNKVACFYDRTIDLGVDIDDVYALLLKYRNGLTGTLLVDVVSRNAVRRITINGDKGQIIWDWNQRYVEVYRPEGREVFKEPGGSAEKGYNSNIIEEMYIDEIRSFIGAVKGKGEFPNTLDEDYDILQLLYKAEKSYDKGVLTPMI